MSILKIPNNFIENMDKQRNDEIAKILEEGKLKEKQNNKKFDMFADAVNDLLEKINVSRYGDSICAEIYLNEQDVCLVQKNVKYAELLKELETFNFSIISVNGVGTSMSNSKKLCFLKFENITIGKDIKLIYIKSGQ